MPPGDARQLFKGRAAGSKPNSDRRAAHPFACTSRKNLREVGKP